MSKTIGVNAFDGLLCLVEVSSPLLALNRIAVSDPSHLEPLYASVLYVCMYICMYAWVWGSLVGYTHRRRHRRRHRHRHRARRSIFATTTMALSLTATVHSYDWEPCGKSDLGDTGHHTDTNTRRHSTPQSMCFQALALSRPSPCWCFVRGSSNACSVGGGPREHRSEEHGWKANGGVVSNMYSGRQQMDKFLQRRDVSNFLRPTAFLDVSGLFGLPGASGLSPSSSAWFRQYVGSMFNLGGPGVAQICPSTGCFSNTPAFRAGTSSQFHANNIDSFCQMMVRFVPTVQGM